MEIHTPERIYYMCATNDVDRDGWIEALTSAKKQLEKQSASATNGNGTNASTPLGIWGLI